MAWQRYLLNGYRRWYRVRRQRALNQALRRPGRAPVVVTNNWLIEVGFLRVEPAFASTRVSSPAAPTPPSSLQHAMRRPRSVGMMLRWCRSSSNVIGPRRVLSRACIRDQQLRRAWPRGCRHGTSSAALRSRCASSVGDPVTDRSGAWSLHLDRKPPDGRSRWGKDAASLGKRSRLYGFEPSATGG